MLSRVLQNVEPHPLQMTLAPLASTSYDNVLLDDAIIGAVVNQNNRHWTAIAKHEQALWHVDSMHSPELLPPSDYAALLQRFPMTFAVSQ